MVQMSGLKITFQRLDPVKWMLYVSTAIINLAEMILDNTIYIITTVCLYSLLSIYEKGTCKTWLI